MNSDTPIFIIGTGRCGTTILYELVAMHPDLAWFSNLSNRHPGSPGWLRFQNILLRTRRVEDYLRKRILIPTRLNRALMYPFRPNEGHDIYSYCGFNDNKRMTESDYDEEMERRLRRLIRMHLGTTAKDRFINKQTANTQRLRLINRIFPNAYYIHVTRDPRAVINSFLNVKFWNDMHVWWLAGKKVSEVQGKDPIELALEHWRNCIGEIWANKHIFKKFMEVRYEDFVRDTRHEVRRILDFCALSFPDGFRDFVPKNLPDKSCKWQEDLTKDQISFIEETVNAVLNAHKHEAIS
jgi:hypothetical protein